MYIYIYIYMCVYIYTYMRAHVHTLRPVSAHVDMQTYRDERRYAGFFLLFFFLFPLLPLFYEKKYRQESPFRYSGKDLIVVGH